MECTVIIPVIEPNSLLTKIVLKTLEIDNNLEIIILYNNLSKLDKHLHNNRVKLIQTNEKNMSAKRNLGAKLAQTKYLAFLDSDAYPEKNWFINAKKLLEEDISLGIITGPELSFPDQTFIENTVGICNRSFLILGSHNFRKLISKSRFYPEASACNIIMKKDDYQMVGGMDPALYLGEDQEFSHRFTKTSLKKIFFSKDVRIFHKDRGFKGYLIQRYARGLTAINLIEKLKSFFSDISIENFIKQRFELFLPFLFIIFLVSTPILLANKFLTILFFITLMFYLLIICIETLRLIKLKLIYFPTVFIFLIIGSITPGFALFFKFFNLKMNIKKLYRNT